MGEVTFLDVSKRFTLRVDGEVHQVQALDRVSFTVHDGEIVALIGPSGCGKTTALRVAMGLDAGERRPRHRGRPRGARLRPRPRHGVPARRTAALAVGAAERHVRPGDEGHARRRLARNGGEISRARRPHRLAEPPPAPAFRRHEAARRHRPRARHRSVRAADGRAVRRARCADARDAAGRAARHPRPHQEDRAVRHPRSRRGGADRRPHRGDARGPRAGGDGRAACRARAAISAWSAARRNSPKPVTRSGARCTTRRSVH